MDTSIYLYNLDFLIKTCKVKQRALANSIDISETLFSKWKKGKSPSNKTLKKLSHFFSDKLNLPYSLFRDGQALLTENFEEIVTSRSKAQGLQNSDKSPTDSTHPSVNTSSDQGTIFPAGQNLTGHEIGMVAFIRELFSGSRSTPLPEATVDRVKETLDIMGVDSDLQFSFLKFVASARRVYGKEEAKGGAQKGEKDQS